MTRQVLVRLLFLLSIAIFPILMLGHAGSQLTNLTSRIVPFTILTLGGAWLFRLGWQIIPFSSALLFTGLTYGTVYKVASFIPDISTYPFSLGWSETSRYFYASLFFAEKIYGSDIPLSVLHPSRYLMQSLPFLIADSPLWLHRIWQVFLWISLTGLTSWALMWRLGKNHSTRPRNQECEVSNFFLNLCFGMFAFLFLFQGPVYYHLSIMVILVLWGYSSKKPLRTWIVLLLTSLWAGISRINWMPVPGMVAATLYIFETPIAKPAGFNKVRTTWSATFRYLRLPILWIMLGSLTGFLSQEVYKYISGNPAEVFGSSFTSSLLWYRLLPNPTYPLGILLSAVLVSLPIMLLAGVKLWHKLRSIHPVRWLTLWGILGVLFSGGVVVSVKIGGGSNLHNLDAYLVLLLLICSAIYMSRINFDKPPDTSDRQNLLARLEPVLLGITIAVPIVFSLSTGSPLPKHDFKAADSALQAISQAIERSEDQGKEVLLISQRHLLTFDLLDESKIVMVSDYELVFLMEMAMAGNRSYLDPFQSDLQAQRFGVILTGPLNTNLQGSSHSFGEENDAWVREVAEPILCYYEPILKIKDPAVMLLTPRQRSCK